MKSNTVQLLQLGQIWELFPHCFVFPYFRVLDVTSSIVHEATSLPQNVAPKLFLPAQVLLNAS